MKISAIHVLVIAYITLADAQIQSCENLFAPIPSPAPTTPPSAAELRKRQEAPPTSVCGYLSDDSWSYYCRAGYYCGFDATLDLFGCCQYSASKLYNCYKPTSCADFGKLSTRNSVDIWMTHSCTDPEYPYCATYYESGLSAMGCNAMPKQTVLLQFTLNGGVSAQTTAASRTGISSAGQGSNSVTGLPKATAVAGPATPAGQFSQTQATGSVDSLPSASSTSSKNGALSRSLPGDLERFILTFVGFLIPLL